MSNFNVLSEVGEKSREKRVTRKTKGKWEEVAGRMEGDHENRHLPPYEGDGGSKGRGLKTGHVEAEPQGPTMLPEKISSAFCQVEPWSCAAG